MGTERMRKGWDIQGFLRHLYVIQKRRNREKIHKNKYASVKKVIMHAHFVSSKNGVSYVHGIGIKIIGGARWRCMDDGVGVCIARAIHHAKLKPFLSLYSMQILEGRYLPFVIKLQLIPSDLLQFPIRPGTLYRPVLSLLFLFRSFSLTFLFPFHSDPLLVFFHFPIPIFFLTHVTGRYEIHRHPR